MNSARPAGWIGAAAILLAVIFFLCSPVSAALTPGETYTILMSKVNSDGTVTDLDSTTAAADSNGKIAFSFSNVPTSPGTFFLVLTVKDSSDTVLRKSFVPAPAEGGAGELGVNDLSTVQTNMILQALASAGTDDPIVVAYGLILTRTPDLSDDDVNNIAVLGKQAIMNGFEVFLRDNGVTAAQLETFKRKLISNSPNKDLSNFTALFKSAVDNPDQAGDDMAMAAGMIAEIFIDAGTAAGIDLGLILAAHDAAGDEVDNDPEAAAAFNDFDNDTSAVIEQAMTNFFLRIAAVKIKESYSSALAALNASGSQINTFNAAVQDMMDTMEELDKQYSPYYEDPQLMTPQVRAQMDSDYSDAFNTFQNDIAASNADIAQMKTNMAAAMGMAEGDLPPDMGTYVDFMGNTVNWPIPQVVAFNWVASVILAGGDLTYDRDAVEAVLPVPANMGWLNGGGTRTDYTFGGPPPSFASLMGVQEDIMIAEHTRWLLWDGGNQPTREEEMANKLAYEQNMAAIVASLGGTADGATPISSTRKKALVKMMEHPELY